MISRVVSASAFGIAALCFGLSFFEVRFNGQRMAEVTGVDLVVDNASSLKSLPGLAKSPEIPAPQDMTDASNRAHGDHAAERARRFLQQKEQRNSESALPVAMPHATPSPFGIAALVCALVGIVTQLFPLKRNGIISAVVAATAVAALFTLHSTVAQPSIVGQGPTRNGLALDLGAGPGLWSSIAFFGLAFIVGIVQARPRRMQARITPQPAAIYTSSMPSPGSQPVHTQRATETVHHEPRDRPAPPPVAAAIDAQERPANTPPYVPPPVALNADRPQAIPMPLTPAASTNPSLYSDSVAERTGDGVPHVESTVSATASEELRERPNIPPLTAPSDSSVRPTEYAAPPLGTMAVTPSGAADMTVSSSIPASAPPPTAHPPLNKPKRNTMYCRNCSNEVNEKAIGCPKCGMDPKKAKNYCPACGNSTAEGQVMCTQCGVSLGGKSISLDASTALQGFDASKFMANKANIAAVVAVIGCFLPWLNVNLFGSQSLNMFNLSTVADSQPGHVLVSGLLYLFPLALIAYTISDFVTSIAKYKKWFLTAALVLVIYSALGLYQVSHPSVPDVGGMGGMFGDAMAKAAAMASSAISIGFGYYLSLLATIAAFVLGRKA